MDCTMSLLDSLKVDKTFHGRMRSMRKIEITVKELVDQNI